jgi:RNA polymerase sigma-70 factor (ECF subfamily)
MRGADTLPDDERSLLADLSAGRPGAFTSMMRQNNRRLWRIARAILQDDSDAEEAVQETYMRAFTHITEFRGEAKLSTWLSTIVVNEALKLRARRVDSVSIEDFTQSLPADHSERGFASPEQEQGREELRTILEHAIDKLAVPFRTVFVMRMIEELSVEEIARCLGVHSITVRTRFYRASRQLRAMLGKQLAGGFEAAFPFGGIRCEQLTSSVFTRLGLLPPVCDPPLG